MYGPGGTDTAVYSVFRVGGTVASYGLQFKSPVAANAHTNTTATIYVKGVNY